jgi:hypothetical protein
MTASFPTSIKTFSYQADGVSTMDAADVNAAYDEITAIETTIQPIAGVIETTTGSALKVTNHNALATAHNLGGATVSDQTLKQWTEGHDYELTAITYDGTHSTIIASAIVKWPDGSAGALTVTAHDNTALKETAYTITHTISGKTVTQAAVTLNADGNITVKPALTVA